MLQRQQGGYILTVEAGRSLLLSADARAESTLQTELMEIQERWRHAHHRLDRQRRELQGLLKVRQKYSRNNREASFILILWFIEISATHSCMFKCLCSLACSVRKAIFLPL